MHIVRRQFCSAVLVAGLGVQLGCADGTGPSAAALTIVTQPSSSAQTMVPLAVQPVIQAVDASDSPVGHAGLLITAVVESGDGAVLAGANATTDANGVATFEDLTLGADDASGGSITLRFTAAGVTPVSTVIELSCAIGNLTLGTAVTDALVIGDCVRTEGSTIGSRYKQYSFDVAAPTKALRIGDTTTSFRPVALVRGPGEPRFLGIGALEGITAIEFKVLVPSGTHRLMATSAEPGRTGSFKLGIVAAAEDEDICEALQFHPPLATNQTLRDTCLDDVQNPAGIFVFILTPGASVSATITSSAFTPFIALWRINPEEEQTNDTGTGSTASVAFTNETGEAVIYYLFVRAADGAFTGAYALDATVTNPPAVRAPALTSIIDPQIMSRLLHRRDRR